MLAIIVPRTTGMLVNHRRRKFTIEKGIILFLLSRTHPEFVLLLVPSTSSNLINPFRIQNKRFSSSLSFIFERTEGKGKIRLIKGDEESKFEWRASSGVWSVLRADHRENRHGESKNIHGEEPVPVHAECFPDRVTNLFLFFKGAPLLKAWLLHGYWPCPLSHGS